MTFIPTRGKLLVRRARTEAQSSGGIYIPDVARIKLSQGEVLAVAKSDIAPNGNDMPMEVRVGDVVTWYPQTGVDIAASGFGDYGEDDTLVVLQLVNVVGYSRSS